MYVMKKNSDGLFTFKFYAKVIAIVLIISLVATMTPGSAGKAHASSQENLQSDASDTIAEAEISDSTSKATEGFKDFTSSFFEQNIKPLANSLPLGLEDGTINDNSDNNHDFNTVNNIQDLSNQDIEDNSTSDTNNITKDDVSDNSVLDNNKTNSLNQKLSSSGFSQNDLQKSNIDDSNNAHELPTTNNNDVYPKGGGTVEDPYLIFNKNQFESLGEILKNNHSAHIKILNDIDMTSLNNWKPFCDKDNAFNGTIDGGGNTITLKSYGDDKNTGGLFGCLGSNACIKNLSVNADLQIDSSHVGIFANDVAENSTNVSIQNCEAIGSIVSNGGYNHPDGAVYGGFIGWVNDGANVLMDNCTNYASLSADNKHTRYSGGLIGYANDNQIVLNNCSNRGSIDAKGAESTEFEVGLMAAQDAFDFLTGYTIDKFQVDWFRNAVKSILKNKCAKLNNLKKKKLVDFCTDTTLHVLNKSESPADFYNNIFNESSGILSDNAKNIMKNVYRPEFLSYAYVKTKSMFPEPDSFKFFANPEINKIIKNSPLYKSLLSSDRLSAFNKLKNDLLNGNKTEVNKIYNKYVDLCKLNDWRGEIEPPISIDNFENGIKLFKYETIIDDNNETINYFAGDLQDHSWIKSYDIYVYVVEMQDPNGYRTISDDLLLDIMLCRRESLKEYPLPSDKDATSLIDSLCPVKGLSKEQAYKNRIKFYNNYADSVAHKVCAKRGDDSLYNNVYNNVFATLLFNGADGHRPDPEMLRACYYRFGKDVFNRQSSVYNDLTSVYIIDRFTDFLELQNAYFSKRLNIDTATLYFNTIRGCSALITSNLNQAASALSTSEGGLGGVHYNGYAGGMVGYCDGDKEGNKITIQNCSNEASITAGHSAGGLIGYLENYDADIVGSSNTSSINATDNIDVSAGGLVGLCGDAKDGQCINVSKSISTGYVLSRKTSGGFFGQINDGNFLINITDCGSLGGVAGTCSVGGFIGREKRIGQLKITNCYSYCAFNTTTLNTTQINLRMLPIWGLPDITLPAQKGASEAGAFVGELDNPESTTFTNCYYLKGNRAVGPDQKSSIPYAEELHEAEQDDFTDGSVAFGLNNGSVSNDAPFGQVIDDVSLGSGSKMYLPLPGFVAPVYKDTHSSNTVYTNYNPRTVKLYRLEFFSQHADVSPDTKVISIKAGDDYSFEVTPENGYDIDKVYYTKSNGQVVELVGNKDASKEKPQTFLYKLEKVDDNLVVNISTKPFTACQPEGFGTSGSPFEIKDIRHLAWFAEKVNSGLSQSLHAKLMNDIDASNYKLPTMLNEVVGYSGTFDGNNHTISGINSDDAAYSLFKYVDGGTIKNLTLNGKFGNAAFADWAHNAKFINCVSQGEISSTSVAAGGICARMWGTDNLFKSCTNEAKVDHSCDEQYTCAGGICGLLTDGTITDRDTNGRSVCAKFDQCVNKGSVCSSSSFDTHAAGIVAYMNAWNREGKLLSGNSVVDITYCENAGNIYGNTDQASCAGIMGCVDSLHTKDGNAKVNILKSVNTGNIGYDESNNKKTVQDASGILCWTYDHSLDVVIDSCIVDGNIWCPDQRISGGSGCAGFIANAEYGHDFTIENSYTTGHILGTHKNKGYFVGAQGTPIVCSVYTIVPWVFNLMVSVIKDDIFGMGPKFNIKNSYYAASGTPNNAYSDYDYANNQHTDEIHQVEESDLVSGSLAYKINADKQSPTFGQNLDMTELKQTSKKEVLDENGVQLIENGVGKTEDVTTTTYLTKQNSPCIIGLNGRPTVPVYEANQNNTIYYTNFNNSSSAGQYSITVSAENGFVNGRLSGNAGENITLNLAPKNTGYELSELFVDDVKVDNPPDKTYTFKSLDKNHKIFAKFVNEAEPKLIDNFYQISNAQEYTWFVNRTNEGKDYNGKLVNDINLTNYPECPQFARWNATLNGARNKSDNFKILRDTNKPLFKKAGAGIIENIDIEVSAVNKENNTAALCQTSDGLKIEHVNISGYMRNLSGNSAAYVACPEGAITIRNCKADVSLSSNGDDGACLAVYVAKKTQNGSVSISDSTSSGHVDAFASKKSYAAAAIAFVESESVTYDINNFANSGNISANRSAGSVFGEINTADAYIDKSHNYDICYCFNSGIISGESCGGLIGRVESTEVAWVNIKNSENSGDVNSNVGSSGQAGGLIGYVNDKDIDVDINGCAVTCKSIKSNARFSGGIIGFLNSARDHVDIKNSFVYCTNLSSSKHTGLLLGANDTFTQSASNVYVYNPAAIRHKYTGDEDDSKEWKDSIKEASYEEFSDGRVAIDLNKSLEPKVFGQLLDFEGLPKDFCPHAGGKCIYDVERKVGSQTKIIHSNYNAEEAKSLYVLTLSNSDKSKGTAEPASDVFVKPGSDYTLKFVGFNGNALSTLKINGEEVTDKSTFVNNEYTIKNISGDVCVDYSFGFGLKPAGTGAITDPYLVATASELMWVTRAMNDWQAGWGVSNTCSIKIMNDIDMTGINFEQVYKFVGELYGVNNNGKCCSINNLSMSGACPAMFQHLENAKVHDLNINVNHTTSHEAAGLAINTTNTAFNNVQINGKITYIGPDDPVIGGFTARTHPGSSTYDNCLSNVTMSCTQNDAEACMGGFIGTNSNEAGHSDVFNSCINNSNITSNIEANYIKVGKDDSAGGFVGKLIGKGVSYKFASCLNSGVIHGDNAGGFVGYIDLDSGSDVAGLHIIKSSNYGEVKGDDVGGFVGNTDTFHDDSNFVLEFCMNYGNITSPDNPGEAGNNAGGFVGNLDAGSGCYGGGNWKFNYCGNVGDITTYGKYSGNGGIVGEVHYVNNLWVDNSFSCGKQENGDGYRGRVFGDNTDKDTNINNFYGVSGKGGDKWKGNSSSGSEDNTHDCSEADFSSGKVAYEINGGTNSFKQILDNHQFASTSQPYPDSTLIDPDNNYNVYRLQDGTYSNFDPNGKKSGDETLALNTINVIVEGPGTVTPSGSIHKYTGESLSVTVKPNDGCQLQDISLDGNNVLNQLTSDNLFTLSNIDKSHTLKCVFSKEIKPKLGSGTAADPYQVSNYNELLWFGKQVNSGQTSICCDLTNDINAFNGNETLWDPIGSNKEYAYKGIFDGKGHQINALSSFKGKQIAMFRYCSDATIKNLTLTNVMFQSKEEKSSAAGLCYFSSGATNISNVAISGNVNASTNESGLINIVEGAAKIEKCYTDCKMSGLYDKYGRVSGGINSLDPKGGEAVINDFIIGSNSSINSNDSEIGYKSRFYDQASGVVTRVEGSGNVKVNSCVNLATVKGDTAGGIVSEVKGGDINVDFINCSNASRVIGDNCGGILGKVEDVSGGNVNFNGCLNSGCVGVIGAVIRHAGGIVGYVNDYDLSMDIKNCCNYGTVINNKNTADNITHGITGAGIGVAVVSAVAGLGALTATAIAINSVLAKIAIAGAATPATYPVTAIAVIIGAFIAIGVGAYALIKTRASVTQFAGGIVGEEDSCSKMSLSNIVNVGAVSATNRASSVGQIDNLNDCQIQSVYTLNTSCKETESDVLEKINRVDFNAFNCGEVGYNLQENSFNKYGDYWFGQRIDLFDKGPREAIPTYSSNSTKIYKHQNDKGTYYSNFAESENKKYSLNVEYCCPDNSLDSQQIIANFETEVHGDRLPNHEKVSTEEKANNLENNNTEVLNNASESANASTDSKYVEKYEAASWEVNTIKIKPKNNNASIVKVEAYDSQLKPITLLENEVVYNEDGSAVVALSDRCNKDRIIKVHCVNNGIHYDTINGQKIAMLPWNSTTELPNEKLGYHSNNYYLTQDITTTQTCNCMKGQVNICLNGHLVIMEGDCKGIVVNDSTSDLRLIDCNSSNTLYNYDCGSDGRVTSINKANQQNDYTVRSTTGTGPTKPIDQDNNTISKGIIWGKENSSIVTIEKGAATLEDVVFTSSADSSPVINYSALANNVETTDTKTNNDQTLNDIKNASNSANIDQSATQNSIIKDIQNGQYGEDCKDYITTSMPDSLKLNPDGTKQYKDVKSNLLFNATVFGVTCFGIKHQNGEDKNLAPLVLGAKSHFINVDNASISTNTTVWFADDYVYDEPVTINSYNGTPYALITNFDNQIEKGVDYRKTLISCTDSRKVVLGGKGDHANEVTLVESNEAGGFNYAKVSISQPTGGNVYPCNLKKSNDNEPKEVFYAPGSDIKLHLKKDQFNNIDKIEIKRNGQVVQTYDSTFTGDVLVYSGQDAQGQISPIAAGEEISIEVSYKPQIDSSLEGAFTPWTSANSLPDKPGKYALQNDVVLGASGENCTEVWEVPAGVFSIDLNGHKIKQTANGKNAIHVNNQNTALTITDSTMVGKADKDIPASMYVQKQTNKHKFDLNEIDVTMYKEVSKEDFDNQNSNNSEIDPEKKIHEVKGGAICGANVEPQSYYAYGTKAGAIVVDSGTFYMHAGNIVANNAGALHLGSGSFSDTERNNNNQGVEGGAALTVDKDANAFIKKDANIAFNSMIGDKDYGSNFFSAGVASKGKLENNGDIYNNLASDFAASAIQAESGQLTNTGHIYNNVSKKSSFGTIMHNCELINSGIIDNNSSDGVMCGVTSKGTLVFDSNSVIADNKYTVKHSDYQQDEVKKSDVYLVGTAAISINENYKTSKLSVVRQELCQLSPITSNWSKLNLVAESVFESPEANLVMCMNEVCELVYADKSQAVNIDFKTIGNGKIMLGEISPKSGKYRIDVSFDMTVVADDSWTIESVKVNGVDVPVSGINEEASANTSKTTNAGAFESSSAQANQGPGAAASNDKAETENKQKIKSGRYIIDKLDKDSVITVTFCQSTKNN